MNEFADIEFRRALNERIAERVFGWQRSPRDVADRPLYLEPDEPRLAPAAGKSYIWVQSAQPQPPPMVAVDFNRWEYAGYVVGRLLPSLSPTQFLAELLAAFNWMPQLSGTVAVEPLEASHLFTQYQADGALTLFGLFCAAHPAVSPMVWKRIVEHLAGLTLADLDAERALADLAAGIKDLRCDGWMDLLANSQNAIPDCA